MENILLNILFYVLIVKREKVTLLWIYPTIL